MSDPVRDILIAAVEAAKYGHPPAPDVAKAIAAGSRELELEQLDFDSLAWMEFCISVELDSGQELTPDVVGGMTRFFEIEDWLRSRS